MFSYLSLIRSQQHQVLSITDPRAISFIISENVYSFPKPRGVRAWFKALLGEGILWVEGTVEFSSLLPFDTTKHNENRKGSS